MPEKSKGWLCWTWDVICSERVLSPVTVLLIHAAIVCDVLWYRPDIWTGTDLWPRSLRMLVLATVMCYLRAALTNPGFVQSPGTSSTAQSEKIASWSFEACLALCCAAALSILDWQRGKEERDGLARSQVKAPKSELPQALGNDIELGNMAEGNCAADEKDASPAAPGDAEGIQKRRGCIEESEELLQLQPRWCKRCHLYQPLRTKHCHDCGRCVRTHDHHCPWIGSCVGEGNRVLFLWFLVFQCTELGVFFVEGVQGISLLEPSVVLLAGLLVIALFFLMVTCLLFYHTFLLLTNLTTWEHVSWKRITYLKQLPEERGSPFARSIAWNVASYCCGAFWCPVPIRRLASLRYEEDGGVIWEMSEQRGMCCCLRQCGEAC